MMSVYEHLPAYYRVAEGRTYTLSESRAYTRTIARTHYENFTVVSWFLPRELRQHMFNVYAYCRWADDLGDEIPDPALALQALGWWRRELQECYAGSPRHPVFVALAETIDRFEIPVDPFNFLLDAFEQDQTVKRFPTYADLNDYCIRSANPVGRLVLYLFGYRDDERQRLSDRTCTALQLANFWQDVTVDWEKGRLYLPQEDLKRFGVGESEIERREFSDRFRELMRFEVERARQLFREGAALVPLVSRRLQLDLALFTRGGETILDLIERRDYNVLSARPVLTGIQKAGLVFSRMIAPLRSPGMANRRS